MFKLETSDGTLHDLHLASLIKNILKGGQCGVASVRLPFQPTKLHSGKVSHPVRMTQEEASNEDVRSSYLTLGTMEDYSKYNHVLCGYTSLESYSLENENPVLIHVGVAPLNKDGQLSWLMMTITLQFIGDQLYWYYHFIRPMSGPRIMVIGCMQDYLDLLKQKLEQEDEQKITKQIGNTCDAANKWAVGERTRIQEALAQTAKIEKSQQDGSNVIQGNFGSR
jgi:hypothetical protein